jgi:hypothetical protein
MGCEIDKRTKGTSKQEVPFFVGDQQNLLHTFRFQTTTASLP